MMNNILFTKTINKQKNIENAVIYCIHRPLSQLITADCTNQQGKMFNIGGIRSTVQLAFVVEQCGAVTSPEVASPDMTSPEVIMCACATGYDVTESQELERKGE
jgi:hypothetical protein